VLLRIECSSSAGSKLDMYGCCVSAGYVLRDGPSMISTEKQAYAYDTEAVREIAEMFTSRVLQQIHDAWHC
jgi:hypothetical protein